MAAYAATVTLAQPTVHKVGKLGVLRGTIDITNYNSTLAAITGITSKFKGAPTVLLGGATANGYIAAWIAASNSVKCWYPSKAQTHGHGLRIIGGRAEGTTDILNATAAAVTLGKEEAGNADILGADAATKGGVLSETLAAGAGTEVANDVNVGAVPFVAFGVAP